MNIVNKDEFLQRKEEFFDRIQKGEVFIYPTDTIYGIGCDAKNKEAVERIREIKKRPNSPFSQIVPSKQWIKDHCSLNQKAKEWLAKLPGPYTLILPGKESGTLGIRMPNHWFTDIVKKLKIPIITTSVNKSGEDPITCLADLSASIRKKVDFFIDEGKIEGQASMLVYLDQDKVKVKER